MAEMIDLRNPVNSTFVYRLICKAALLAALMFVGASPPRAQVSIGIQIGAPPPPRVLAVVPATPGPDYVWIEGYWYPAGRHYRWHPGYWSEAPYPGARWIAPHYDGERYFAGYWDGDRGRFEHDHRWDRDRDRDRGRWREHEDRDRHEDHDHQGEDHR